ncbi:protein RKD4-like [Nicotiana tabacum]|uniref:Protein RKD4-like n=1 Tax=Nicotiana tabacum TaxID=4097 RepID=A0A1S4A5E2_TOBAC|nr:PREDICTED: protein RKD4-like [Nicotiana tabacum]
MDSHVLTLENQNDQFDWLYSEHPPPPFGTWQHQDSRILSNGGLFNFEYFDPFQFPSDIQNNHLPTFFDLKEFEEICQDLGTLDVKLPPFQEEIPLNMTFTPLEECQNYVTSTMISSGEREIINGTNKELIRKRNNNGRHKKSDALELDEIQRYFHVPINKAAKELRVGLTVLKKRCRELNIMRWPHRKIKSLQTLIDSVKEMGLTSEVEMLEEHQRMLEKVPEMELTERTKKLRQTCFKANYKKRRAAMAAFSF